MKKLGDAIGRMDMAGHMGRGKNSEAAENGFPPYPLSSVVNLNTVCEGGACPPPIIPPPHTQIRDVVSLGEAVNVARSMGIPDWYAAYWHKSMSASGWVTTRGRKITERSWPALLMKWWANSSETEKARVLADYNAEQKSAAEEADDPEPVIAFTLRHWHGCQSMCANFQHGKCVCGAKRPACFCACNDGFTEKCRAFKPLPLAWQNVWRLESKVWEPYWVEPNKAYPQGYMFKGWKATKKGQAVKAYFDAHPDELEEARWRDEANAVTEVEKRDSDVYLAWVRRERARGKTKEAAMK